MTNVADILRRYRDAGRLIAVAESCTGGLLAGALTDPPGASDVFERGFVTYSNSAKMDLLGVSKVSLDAHGAVSETVAREMSEGALRNSTAHVALSVTGIAGPGSSEFKPEGRVCFGLSSLDHKTHVETCEFGPRGRAEVRKAAVEHGLSLLARAKF